MLRASPLAIAALGAAIAAQSVITSASTPLSIESPAKGLRLVGADVSTPPQRVPLGEGELLQGLPGSGSLSAEELQKWLSNAANHAALQPVLPVGLDQGELDRQGLKANPLTRAKIELGRQLFFDPRLSIDGTIRCASCHDPDHGFADPQRFSVGVRGQFGTRNTPTAANRLLSAAQFWDGRADSLEAQAIGPLANPTEMGFSHAAVVGLLEQVLGYRIQFETIFAEGVTIENAALALACFERALVTGPTPWDHRARRSAFEVANADDLAAVADAAPEDLDADDAELLADYGLLIRATEAMPLSAPALRGSKLFFGERGGCFQCHAGANFSDEQYHNLGIGLATINTNRRVEPLAANLETTIDWGRYTVTKNEADRGAFKTPTLRNVTQTPPYMHDGSLATLNEVIEWYVGGGHRNPWQSEKIQPLDLSVDEQSDLVAFLEALTGAWPQVERGRLPE
ncbi:cytochrome-c peroxidase [Botrimarina hoheduenensis]|uniref:Cytochrome c551 peroxidase n=1 Tax=Botrimarina hoheduenensis TaxID=2528000 RepID=A0A5C5W9R4_9BACT|nr:cytochrome c peroxidase [Botrimarina hoheduenensis]TWT47354.1 Cytochrome c551 peroxidase precursor [Botrimarina hoheduenensis]